MTVKQLPIICLAGPTAVGKSQLAIDLAEQLPCDIISVDSVMVYRGMNIGTAKPNAELLEHVPHQLIDIRDPISPYSVGDFFRDIQAIIQTSVAKQRIPLLVGGTMLYFNTLRQGLADLPNYSKYPIYPSLKVELEKLDSTILYKRLQQCDAVTAKCLHQHDRQRIQRALLVYYLSKKTLSSLQQSAQKTLSYPMIWIALHPSDRAILRERIAIRFEAMLAQGFLEEVKCLYSNFSFSEDLPAYRAVGYRQAFEYLNGKSDYNTFITRSITATCQLAKRQLTWLRAWKDMVNFNADEPALLAKVSQHINKQLVLNVI